MSVAQSNHVEGRRGGIMMDPLKLDLWDPLNLWDMCPINTDFKLPIHIPVDWLETDQAHIFKANLPGLKKEDVKVQVEERVMHISGECKRDEVDKNDKWRCLERPHGSFSRHFRLPENAMLDHVKGNMANGVLTLTVPKAPASKAKVMSVNVSEN